jgi:hypothetical protein
MVSILEVKILWSISPAESIAEYCSKSTVAVDAVIPFGILIATAS